MIVEVLFAAAVVLGGLGLVTLGGVRDWRFAVPMAVLAGLSLYVLIGATQAMIVAASYPIASLLLAAILPWVGVGIAVNRRWIARTDVPLGLTAATTAAAGLLGALLFAMDRSTFHVDTIEYLTIGAVLYSGTFVESVSLFQLEKRMLVMPMLHVAANLDGRYALLSATPLIAVATAWLVWAFTRTGLRATTLSPAVQRALSFAPLGLLLSLNRFGFHAIYMNGHLLFGALLLAMVIAGYFLLRRDPSWGDRVLIPVTVMTAAFTISRPEAGIVAALALAPLLVSASVSRRAKVALLLSAGVPLVVWQGFLAVMTVSREVRPGASVLGMLGLGLALIACVALLRMRWLTARPGTLLLLGEGALWAMLAVLAIRDRSVLTQSLRATFENVVVGSGGWGASFVFVCLIGLVVILALRTPGREAIRFPLTTFIPLAYVLAYLRDGAYRVAEADSLNRMIIQVVPLLIAIIATALWSERARGASPLAATHNPAVERESGGREKRQPHPAGAPVQQD